MWTTPGTPGDIILAANNLGDIIFEHASDTCIVRYRSIGGGGNYIKKLMACKQCVGQMHKQSEIHIRYAFNLSSRHNTLKLYVDYSLTVFISLQHARNLTISDVCIDMGVVYIGLT